MVTSGGAIMNNPVKVSFRRALGFAESHHAAIRWANGERSRDLAEAIIGGLSAPSKMPCFGYSTPADACKAGRAMAQFAGAICSECYAGKGAYEWDSAAIALGRRERIVQRALRDSEFRTVYVDAFVWLLNTRQARGTERAQWFRWHDSGDIWSVAHLRIIAEIAEQTPGVRHWIPTREYRFVRGYLAEHGAFPSNLRVRLSSHWFDQAVPSSVASTPGVSVSTAHTSREAFDRLSAQGYRECPASKRGGECGDCRHCWVSSEGVTYAAH